MSDLITFGTDGWRAIIADQFTFANVERVAYAVGCYVRATYGSQSKTVSGYRQLPVLVGYDTRFMADKFACRAAQVLISMGVPALVSVRDIPTPAIAWAVQAEPTAGALQITASHNPPEYCGMKYIPHFAGPATNDITGEIAAHLQDIPPEFRAADCSPPVFDAQGQYLAQLKDKVDLERISSAGLRIAYDAIYSTSRDYLDKILRGSGVDVRVLHNWRDPLFGGGMPEPKAEYLKELMQLVVDQRCAAGVATDGDADRFAVIDETGTYLSPNQLLALLTRHLVKNRGQRGAIVRTVATTHLLDHLAGIYGLELIETPVGFKYIGEVMRERDVLIGGEESGGVSVKGHIPEKDGILSSLLLIEMLAFERKPLSQIWSDLLRETGVEFNYRRQDLNLTPSVQRRLMEALGETPFPAIGRERVETVGRKDGLKYYLDQDNWLLVRPSGTEPLMRLYFEGTTRERVDRLASEFNRLIDAALVSLSGMSPVSSPAAGIR